MSLEAGSTVPAMFCSVHQWFGSFHGICWMKNVVICPDLSGTRSSVCITICKWWKNFPSLPSKISFAPVAGRSDAPGSASSFHHHTASKLRKKKTKHTRLLLFLTRSANDYHINRAHLCVHFEVKLFSDVLSRLFRCAHYRKTQV